MEVVFTILIALAFIIVGLIGLAIVALLVTISRQIEEYCNGDYDDD